MAVPVNVVNKPGGGGEVAFSYLDQQRGDGRFLTVIPINLVTNHVAGKSRFTYTHFTPIAQLYSEYVAFAVAADSPLDGKGLIGRLRKDTASVSFGFASSAGNQNHITIALMAKAAGVEVRRLKTVVFSSGGAATTAMLGGHIDVSSSGASGLIRHQEAGKARIIAVAAPARMHGPMAKVPTWRELGLDVVFSTWRSMIGPKDMTEAQVAYWDEVVRRLMATEEWKEMLARNLWVDQYMSSRDSEAFLRRQYAEIRDTLAELGLAAKAK